MNTRIDEKLYQSIHSWLRYYHGKSNKCENKKCTGRSTNYHWALKKGKDYEYKKANFMQLCVSCHQIMDTTDVKREKMRQLNANTHKTHCKRGHLLAGENLLIFGIERHCRICKNERQKQWKIRKKEKALSPNT